jgi:hypothetical protein
MARKQTHDWEEVFGERKKENEERKPEGDKWQVVAWAVTMVAVALSVGISLGLIREML